MKKLLLPIILLIPFMVVAQPTLTYRTHGLKAGENNTMQQVQYIAPGEAGARQTWDYRYISPIADSRTETVESGNNGRISVLSAAGAGRFTYKCDRQANVYEAYDAPGHTIIYEQPITKIRYPFTYGDALYGSFNALSFYGGDVNADRPHALSGNMAGNYSSEADAYGVLLLPNNVVLNNVLRIKTKESYVEEICSNVHIEIEKYLWYTQEYRYPVFVTWNITYTYENGRTTTANESFCTSADLAEILLPEVPIIADEALTAEQIATVNVKPEVAYSVYPNPYNAYFHLTYTLEKETTVDIALFSATGQYITHLVKNKKQNGIQHITYNPSSANLAGFYFLRMMFDNKVYVQSLVKE